MIQTNWYFPFCALSYTSEQLYLKEGYTAWNTGYKVISLYMLYMNIDSRWHFCALLEFSTFEMNYLKNDWN